MDSNTDSLYDLCRLRSTLESFAISLCHEKQLRGPLKESLQRILPRLKSSALAGDYIRFHQADIEFHRTMVETAKVDKLTQIWSNTAESVDSWTLRVKHDCWPNLTGLYREHELLLERWTESETHVAQDACHHHLEEGWQRMNSLWKKPDSTSDPIERAAAFLSTHYANHIEISYVAQHICYTSESNLYRLFRNRYNMSPYAFLRQIRLERAAQLLKSTQQSIAEIAQRCGYRNLSHFSRDFRIKYGSPPGASRAE
jgi:AraC-like DNA-binding protein